MWTYFKPSQGIKHPQISRICSEQLQETTSRSGPTGWRPSKQQQEAPHPSQSPRLLPSLPQQLGLPWIKGTRSPKAIAEMEEERAARMWWRLPSLKPEHMGEGEIGVLHGTDPRLLCLQLRGLRAPSVPCLGNGNISGDTLDNAYGSGKEILPLDPGWLREETQDSPASPSNKPAHFQS